MPRKSTRNTKTKSGDQTPSSTTGEVAFRPNPGPQEEFLAAPERQVLYGGPLHLDTEVITHKGLVKMGDLRIGDKVLSPSGSFISIVDIPFEGVEESYELTFSNGRKVIASEGHRWHVGTSDWAKTQTTFRERLTKDLLDFKLSRGRNRYFLPSVTPYEGTKCEEYITPYLLGVLLADGCITKSVAVYSEDSEIIGRVTKELPKDYTLVYSGKVCFRIVKTKGKGKEFRDELKKLELYGKNAFQKHIPEPYFHYSPEDRLALLQGLMDSDGTVRKFDGKRRGAGLKYTTVSKQLAEDVRRLSESLGFTTTCYTEVLNSGSLVYRILLYGQTNPFFLSRKRLNFEKFLSRASRLYITDIKPVGKQPVKCITVDSVDELFVLSHCIVTKNSAGGGKSYALIADPMRYFNHPEFQGLVVRRSTEELRELIRISKQLYYKIFPGAKFTERDKTWYFPSGASFWMSYLERDDDVMRYQGQAFSWIGFDELTQWPTPYAWDYLASRLRNNDSTNLPLSMRATSNPGGPGHTWVKKMFIDPAPWGEPFWATDIETSETLTWSEKSVYAQENNMVGKPLFKRRFIPAKLKDNPYLYNSGDYESNLLSLPEHKREMLLYGSWDMVEGAAFPEWNPDYHVCDPFDVPEHWPRFRSCDYGYNDHSSVVWFAVAPTDQLFVYREIHVNGLVAEDLAERIAKVEKESGDRVSYGILDSSMWNNYGERGPSRAEVMNNKLREKGCKPFRKSDRSKGSRIDRKNEFHRRLKIIDEMPGIIFFRNCRSCISTIPVLPLDKNNSEDVDTKADDHDYDAVTYGIMTRPVYRVNQSSRSANRFIPQDEVFGY